jgi:hypothetical protein
MQCHSSIAQIASKIVGRGEELHDDAHAHITPRRY